MAFAIWESDIQVTAVRTDRYSSVHRPFDGAPDEWAVLSLVSAAKFDMSSDFLCRESAQTLTAPIGLAIYK
jgi:hypothetical protein